MDNFSDFVVEKNFSTDKNIQGKKTIDPRSKSSKSNYTQHLGATGHKQKFKPRDRVSRSNYDKAIGRRKRRGSKTKAARNILANKFGVKKAVQKDANNRYVLKHLQIQEIIKKFGYVYDNNKMAWTNNEKPEEIAKQKKKTTHDSKPETNIDVEAPNGAPKVDIEKDEESNGDDEFIISPTGEKININDTKFSFIGNGGIEYDITEDDLRSYSARLMLARFFGMPSALKFEEAEEENEGPGDDGKKQISVYVDPVIPREKVLDKLESIGYSWNTITQDWQSNKQSIYDIFANNENAEPKNVMLGRVYLAILGFLHAFEYEDNEPTMTAEEVVENMQVLGFVYNEETKVWEHFNG
jgi:hypothetical protein